MRIEELYLKSFGKFSGKRISFGDGINVIYGHNEAGKTTVYHAVGAMLFGLERQRGRASQTDGYKTYQPWEYPTVYAGSMRFETGGKIFCIERNFYQSEKSARLFCETDGEELCIEQGDLQMLLGEVTGELYFNTAAAGQMKMKPQDILGGYLKNHIAALEEEGSGELDVVQALSILEKKRKELEQQKKKSEAQLRRQIADLEAQSALVQQELGKSRQQLELVRQRAEEPQPAEKSGFLAMLFRFLKRLFFYKKYQREQEERRKQHWKRREKESFLQELCGEKESLLEELAMERDALFERLHEQSKEEKIQAVMLAAERIRQLSVLRREEVMERLVKKASEVLCLLTEGRYRKLFWEEGKEPEVWDGYRRIRMFQLSAGCTDQVYLSLRIALQDLFFSEEQLPLIFDDAFVCFDEERLERLLSYLPALDRQVIILTCHGREAQLLEKQGIFYRKIIL